MAQHAVALPASDAEIAFAPVTHLAQWVSTRKISSERLTKIYLDRDDAEAARAERIGAIARRFYTELPQAMAGRGTRAPLSARERAARRWWKH